MSDEISANGDFEAFFQSYLAPRIALIEQKRRQAWGRAVFIVPGVFLLVFVVLAALVWGRVGDLAFSGGALLGAAIVSVVLSCVIVYAALRSAVRDFKPEIVGAIVKFIGPELEYFPCNGVSESEFAAARLFPSRVDRYHSEDLVAGRIGATRLRFAEVHAEEKIQRGKNTTWQTIFRGTLMIADFNKNFSGVTVVLPDQAEKLLGGWLGHLVQQYNFTAPGQLVELEDPEFEERFVVYSADQVEARYLLTPALLRRMLELRERYREGVCFSFIGGAIYIAIRNSRDRFEPTLLASLENATRAHYADLRDCAAIVEELNLNTRIWSKE